MNSQRVRSLDVFRGLTVALMILVNNPGTWTYIYDPFRHAPWHGLTPTDLVFPFFLFAVGNAIAFVKLDPKKILKRTLLIFLIGLLLNWSPFLVRQGDELVLKTWTWVNATGDLVGVRVMGVLQRIALAYGCAAMVIYFSPRRALLWAFLILILSTGLALGFGIFGHALDPWSLEGFFGTAVDRVIFGEVHLYHGEGVAFDPEGIMSTLAPISQVLIGYWVGRKFVIAPEKLKSVLLSGIALLSAGYLWSVFQPINKKIWTSSYTLVTSGYAVMVLVAIAWALREWQTFGKRVAPVFEIFGRNPLFIYVLSGFIPRVLSLFPPTGFYDRVCALCPGPPENGSLLFAVTLVFFYWMVGKALDRNKIYIKV